MRFPLLMAEAGADGGAGGAGASQAPGATEATGFTDWRMLLPEDMRTDKGLDRFKDLGSLYTSYRDIERKMGERAIPKVPGKDDPPELHAAWRQALGVPEAPDKYDIKDPQLPEGFQFDPQLKADFLKTAHGLNLSSAQVQALMDWQAQLNTRLWDEGEQARQGQIQAGDQAGRQKWGAQWPVKLALAKTAIARLGDADLQRSLDELVISGPDGKQTHAGNHPAVIELLANYAQAMGHDQFVIQEGGGVLSQQSANERLQQAYADHRAGKIDTKALEAAIERYAPVAYTSR